jgi:hypothetical protein
MKSLQGENPLSQQVPIECLQVTEIKNNPMSFWNRPLVERAGPDDAENFVGSHPSFRQTLKQLMPKPDFLLSDYHVSSQPSCPGNLASPLDA